MDSLTQIVLGAAVGEVVLGRKIGNKALMYGAIAGTMPDLDVAFTYVFETSRALELHRGFSHSILFAAAAAPLSAWLVSRYEQFKDIKAWSWFFFWIYLTHSLLDAFTTWGTQLFWPAEWRVAFQTIFVIDPLYTLPFFICMILVLFQKRHKPQRRFYATLGLLVSSIYLLSTVILKQVVNQKFEAALKAQGIAYTQFSSRPSALNTILWNVNVDAGDRYLLGYYSFLNDRPIHFSAYPKKHDLLGDLAADERLQRMVKISKGWYIITEEDGQLYFNDLRFGLLGLDSDSDFVFKYHIGTDADGKAVLTEVKKTRVDAKKVLGDLWQGIQGD